MNKIKHIGFAAFIASSALLSGQAVAASVTVAGNTVSFTFDSALTGLFGAPTVVGDSIFFTPTSFKALSSNREGFDFTSQTFNIAVNANAGYEVAGASLTEQGDYYIIKSRHDRFAGVAVGGKFIMRDLEAPAHKVSSGIFADAPLTDTTSLFHFETSEWMASANLDVPSSWGGADGIVSGVNLTLQNLLIASSFKRGTSAFIEKKFAGIEIFTTPVPEPETYALFLAGLGLVGFIARRRSDARV
jgi:hypothetical protein